jgi:hypothetical protein
MVEDERPKIAWDCNSIKYAGLKPRRMWKVDFEAGIGSRLSNP